MYVITVPVIPRLLEPSRFRGSHFIHLINSQLNLVEIRVPTYPAVSASSKDLIHF